MDPQRVEIKFNIGSAHASKVKKRLGFEKREASRATIWFCDQPQWEGGQVHFELFDRGMIVRLRHRYGDESDSTVKYRRDAPLVLPDGWAPETTPNFKVEGDWTMSSRKVSASLDSTVDGAIIDRAGVNGSPLPADLFSGNQERFAAALMKPETVRLAGLRPLGPIHAWRWEEAPREDLDHELGAEEWTLDGLRFLELSIRVKYENAMTWQGRLAEWAAELQLPTSSVGMTKTQAVLEHLARHLASPP